MPATRVCFVQAIGFISGKTRIISLSCSAAATTEETGLSRKGIQKALSEDGNPELAIIHAMGYRLSPQKLEA